MGGSADVNAGGWDRRRLLVVLAAVVATAMLLLLGLGYAVYVCLLYTSPSPRDGLLSRMPSSA